MSDITQKESTALRLRRHLREHERSLALIGAVLVFTTFVVKEAMRDHYKDIEDALGATRGLFLIRDDLSHLQQGVQRVRVDEQITRAIVEKNENPYLVVTSASRLVDDISYNLSRWNTILDTVADLLASIPHGADAEATAASLHERLRAADEQNRGYSRAMAQQPVAAKGAGQGAPGDIDNSVFKLHADVADIAKSIDKFAGDTSVAAQQEARASERRYRICTVIGYFTFGLGWLLAFIGRLAGITGPGE